MSEYKKTLRTFRPPSDFPRLEEATISQPSLFDDPYVYFRVSKNVEQRYNDDVVVI
jgi:hypothetical protein